MALSYQDKKAIMYNKDMYKVVEVTVQVVKSRSDKPWPSIERTCRVCIELSTVGEENVDRPQVLAWNDHHLDTVKTASTAKDYKQTQSTREDHEARGKEGQEGPMHKNVASGSTFNIVFHYGETWPWWLWNDHHLHTVKTASTAKDYKQTQSTREDHEARGKEGQEGPMYKNVASGSTFNIVFHYGVSFYLSCNTLRRLLAVNLQSARASPSLPSSDVLGLEMWKRVIVFIFWAYCVMGMVSKIWWF